MQNVNVTVHQCNVFFYFYDMETYSKQLSSILVCLKTNYWRIYIKLLSKQSIWSRQAVMFAFPIAFI